MAKFRTIQTKQGDFHRIDKGGNHFINGKCVNPTCASGGNIGDTYPKELV